MPATYLAITHDDVGFHKKDPGYLRQKEPIELDNYILPSLAKGQVVEKLGQTDSGWFRVRRTAVNEKQGSGYGSQTVDEGYVDPRYTEIIVRVELAEVYVKVGLTPWEKKAIATCISSLLHELDDRSLAQPLSSFLSSFFPFANDGPFGIPTMLKVIGPYWGKEVRQLSAEETIIAIYTILEWVVAKKPCEDFADIILELKVTDDFHRLLDLVRFDHINEHSLVITRLLYMLLTSEMQAFIEQKVWDKVVEEAWGAAAMALFTSPLIATPLLMKKLKHSTKSALNRISEKIFNDPLLADDIGYEVQIYCRMRTREVRFWLNRNEDTNASMILLDYLLLVDQSVTFLFDTSGKSILLKLLRLSNKVIEAGKKGNNAIPGLKYIPTSKDQLITKMSLKSEYISDVEAILWNDPHPLLSEVYDYKADKLLYPLPSLKGYKAAQEAKEKEKKKLPQPAAAPAAAAAQAPQSKGAILTQQVRNTILTTAAYMNDFLYSDAMKVLVDGPTNLVSFINQRLKSIIRPLARQYLLPVGARGLTDNVSWQDLKGNKQNIADALDWAALTRMWFYQLGSVTELSPVKEYKIKSDDSTNKKVDNGKVLILKDTSFTNKMLKKHPFSELLLAYTKCRVANDDADGNGKKPFEVFLHYDFDLLVSSVVTYDITLNLIGSFTIKVIPAKNGKSISFELTNNLSLKSATRFRRDSRTKGIDGIILDHDRIYNHDLIKRRKVREDEGDKELVDMGGTLLCIWSWTELI